MGTVGSPGARPTAHRDSYGKLGARSTGLSKRSTMPLPDPHWKVRDYQWCLWCELRAVDPDDPKQTLCPACQAELSSK